MNIVMHLWRVYIIYLFYRLSLFIYCLLSSAKYKSHPINKLLIIQQRIGIHVGPITRNTTEA